MSNSAELERAMDETHSALMTGDLVRLASLFGTTERLAEGLTGLDLGSATRLKRKAERNTPLIEAAARGLQSARGRLREISAEPALTTYDARGHKAVYGQVMPTQLKRI